MKNIKYLGYFLLALLAIFILYGIYYAIIAYLFVLKMIAIALIMVGIVAFFNKKIKKKME
jgi:hypothetical protein